MINRCRTQCWLLVSLMVGSLSCQASGGEEETSGMETEVHAHTNRLADEKSPYLLQHAHNPVDWYPWGEEAFARARDEDKPIFLSIGYSTCHWCHVMERESFEKEAVAAILNEHFISIKVDREERPDVDNVYMAAVQAMTGGGGWPLSAFLTPDRHPFYAGTYFPPEDAYGRPGFSTLLNGIAGAWQNRRDELLATSERVIQHLGQKSTSQGGAELGVRTLSRAAEQLVGSFDAVYGGFGKAPKFPRSHSLSFLLRQWLRSGDDQLLQVVEVTLDHMARGGMADHLGGGFHRYSTDARWLVPHFEKMLYDQALLARTYLEAYQVTGNERYADVARGIFSYVLRDLADPEGGFHSAEDADSEGEEGTFYVWRPEEIAQVLGEETGKLFGAVYGVTDAGNFEHTNSILHLPLRFEEAAAQQGMDVAELEQRLAAAREKLLEVRSRRQRPHLDDKVITSWNALMISAFTIGARVLDEPRYAEAAERATRFILDRLRTEEGLLLRRYRDGEAAFTGYIDDYAFFLGALIDLYEATFNTEYLAEAKSLAKSMQELFWDEEDGGFLFRARTGEELVIDTKEIYDGAEPSGNSVAALALLRLGDLTGDPEITRLGREVLSVFSADIERFGSAVTQMLSAVDFAIGPTMEIVVAGDPQAEDSRRMVRELYARYLPNAVVAFRPDGEEGAAISALAPFLSEQYSLEGRATAYVCRNHACSLPTSDVAQMLELIGPAPTSSLE